MKIKPNIWLSLILLIIIFTSLIIMIFQTNKIYEKVIFTIMAIFMSYPLFKISQVISDSVSEENKIIGNTK